MSDFLNVGMSMSDFLNVDFLAQSGIKIFKENVYKNTKKNSSLRVTVWSVLSVV